MGTKMEDRYEMKTKYGHTEEPVHMHRKIHWKRFFLRQSREQTVWSWMYS